MNSWNDDYLMNYDSLRFYLREHHRISNEELIKFFEDPDAEEALGKTAEDSHKELHGVIVKVLSNLYHLFDMVQDVDLYKEEYEDIELNESHYTEKFPELDAELQEKYRKYGLIKYLKYYQNRYDELFSNQYGENKRKLNPEEHIL